MRIEQLYTFIEAEKGIIADESGTDKKEDILLSASEHQLNAWTQLAGYILIENELKRKFQKWNQENPKPANL